MSHPPPLKGWRLAFATFAISLGTFLITLDQFIANVSIPSIAGDLGVSTNNGAWVITSFTVATAIMIPLTGRLTAMIGAVRLFGYSTILFSIISLLCGLSTSLPMLIFFRVLQGAVSGSLIPLSQTLLFLIYPQEKKGLAIGFWGLVIMVGPAMGPVLGGWITDNINWSWIFYINVPTGIFAGVASLALLHEFETPRRKVVLNKLTLFLFALAIGSWQVILDKGQDLDWFNSPIIITLAIVCIVALCYFVILNKYSSNPIIEFHFLKDRNFLLGTIAMSLSMMVLFGTFVIQPLWVQAQLGYTPYWAGLTLAPVGVFSCILFPLLGYYMNKLNLKLTIGLGFLILSGTFFWYSNLYSSVAFVDIAFPRLIQGIGFALFYLPITAIALMNIRREELPSASGLFAFARILFLSAGVSTAVTMWTRRQSFYQSRYVEYVIPANPAFPRAIERLNELGFEGRMAEAMLLRQVEIESYTQSILDLSFLGAWITVGLLLLVFFFRTKKPVEEKLT